MWAAVISCLPILVLIALVKFGVRGGWVSWVRSFYVGLRG